VGGFWSWTFSTTQIQGEKRKIVSIFSLRFPIFSKKILGQKNFWWLFKIRTSRLLRRKSNWSQAIILTSILPTKFEEEVNKISLINYSLKKLSIHPTLLFRGIISLFYLPFLQSQIKSFSQNQQQRYIQLFIKLLH